MNRSPTSVPAGHSTVRRLLLALSALSPAILGFPLQAVAQSRDWSDLPLIEPRLTRILGADTLQIQEPALSPDGRWVLFSTQSQAGGGYLYLVSSDGGQARLLIDDPDALEPAWFPEGNRIAYYSRESAAIMAAPFDGRTGRLSGPPQRVTLERAMGWFRLSPDGKWIAYRVWADQGGMGIKVVPSNGGTAKTLDTTGTGILALLDWSADGKYVYFGQEGQNFRVPVDGGPPEAVPGGLSGPSAPVVPFFAFGMPGNASPTPLFLVVGFDGRPVARIALPSGATPPQPGRSFTSDGTRLLTVVSNTASPVRVLPVAGGPPRQLGDARAPEMPLGWSADGREVLFATQLDGRQSIMSVPVAGGAAREIGPLPDRGTPTRDEWANPITVSADGRYLTYSRPTPDSSDRTLVVRPVAGGEERVITQSLVHHSAFRLVGPGGTPNLAGTEFLYLERRGDRVELRATSQQGSSRLLRSFDASDVGRGKPRGVFQDRVAFTAGGIPSPTTAGVAPPARILVARGPGGEAKEVAAVPGVVAFDDLAWSPDGRWLAATAYVENSDNDYIKVLVVGVTPEGDVSSPPRLIDTPTTGSAWGLRWLPDGSAVTLYGQSSPTMRFDIWLVPVRSNGRAVALTRDDPGGIGFNVLSPDGRQVAYQVSVDRGTSLWLADMGDALSRLRR